MLKRIIRKRTGIEKEAWSLVRNLMPRGRKTRGIQYEVLEYLFLNLYLKVSEADLHEHLEKVRGKLQKTGDPVKGAINLAIKELQRLPKSVFKLVKIQEIGASGRMERYVQMIYTRFEEVINFRQYQEYLADLLQDEGHLLIRCIANLDDDEPTAVFPGLGNLPTDAMEVEALLNVSRVDRRFPHRSKSRFVPDSVANHCFLMVYESREIAYPFLAFVCDAAVSPTEEEAHFILYRGEEKLTKLKFLDHLWRGLWDQALSRQEASILREQARTLSDQWEKGISNPGEGALLNVLAQRAIRGRNKTKF